MDTADERLDALHRNAPLDDEPETAEEKQWVAEAMADPAPDVPMSAVKELFGL